MTSKDHGCNTLCRAFCKTCIICLVRDRFIQIATSVAGDPEQMSSDIVCRATGESALSSSAVLHKQDTDTPDEM